MTWTSVPQENYKIYQEIKLWIDTARKANPYNPESLYNPYHSESWPSSVDFIKSALYERIRSGKGPLPEPPPVGFACPWYAIVEDEGPHLVSWNMNSYTDVWFPNDKNSIFKDHPDREKMVVICQNIWFIEEKISDTEYIVKDGRHETSYRFRLWFDENHNHPQYDPNDTFFLPGAWLIRNVEFEKQNV